MISTFLLLAYSVTLYLLQEENS